MNLNITTNISKCNCQFCAIDNTDYSTMLDKLVFVEFLCYFAYKDDVNTLLPIKQSKKISIGSENDYKTYGYNFDYDGRYIYNKYAIYNIESLYSDNQYLIKDKIFYYNNNIYIGLQNVNSLQEINASNSNMISNWYELKNYIGQYINYFYTTELFTICKLNKCVINYQKQTLFNKLESCKKICKTDYTKELRDFLFISIHVLSYLICNENYEEAQRILESLSACGELCNDTVFLNSTNNCNCKNG